MNDLKKYIKDLVYNVKNVFSLNLNEIIESGFENAFEILDELGIIAYIKREYKIDYKKPKLEILKDNPTFLERIQNLKIKLFFQTNPLKER
jgi:hypothetical protein